MDPVFDISIEQILEFCRKLMLIYKKVMAWLGILVLPEETTAAPEETVTGE